MKVWPSKDPDEILRYGYDWSPDLVAGEVITTILLAEAVEPAGTVVEASQHDDHMVTLVISGGVDGGEASYIIRVETSIANVFEDTVALPIASKVVPEIHPGGYVPPTPADLVALYPEFAEVSQLRLQYYLDRAARSVDETWLEGDFAHARMLLAAHNLTINGIGNSTQALAVANGSGAFRSMSIGALSLERFDKASTSGNSGGGSGGGSSSWDTTGYGREFKLLLSQNKRGPRVAGYGALERLDEGDRSQSPTYYWNL